MIKRIVVIGLFSLPLLAANANAQLESSYVTIDQVMKYINQQVATRAGPQGDQGPPGVPGKPVTCSQCICHVSDCKPGAGAPGCFTKHDYVCSSSALKPKGH